MLTWKTINLPKKSFLTKKPSQRMICTRYSSRRWQQQQQQHSSHSPTNSKALVFRLHYKTLGSLLRVPDTDDVKQKIPLFCSGNNLLGIVSWFLFLCCTSSVYGTRSKCQTLCIRFLVYCWVIDALGTGHGLLSSQELQLLVCWRNQRAQWEYAARSHYWSWLGEALFWNS